MTMIPERMIVLERYQYVSNLHIKRAIKAKKKNIIKSKPVQVSGQEGEKNQINEGENEWINNFNRQTFYCASEIGMCRNDLQPKFGTWRAIPSPTQPGPGACTLS